MVDVTTHHVPFHATGHHPRHRTFTQSSKLQDVLYEIRGPVHEHASRLEAEGHRILKLNIGNPAPFGFEAPDVIMRDIIQALPNAQGYSDSKGILPARRAVVTRYELVDGFPRFDVEDVYLGCANPEGATGGNIARQAALWADLPVTVAGGTINRFCSSGLNAIALAAHQIRDGADIMVGGGVESISLVQFGPKAPAAADGRNRALDEKLLAKIPAIYMTMIETAEIVARVTEWRGRAVFADDLTVVAARKE